MGRLLGPAAADKAMIASPDKPHELRQSAQQLLERDVIRPIIDQALRTPDPIESTLTLGLAELSRVFHTHGLLLGRKLSRGAATMEVDGLSQFPLDEIKILSRSLVGWRAWPPRSAGSASPRSKE